MIINSNVSSLGMLVSWNVKCVEKQYYTLNVHYSYLKYLSTKYRSIILITSVVDCKSAATIDQQYCINTFNNIDVVRLPPFTSSIKAVFNYFQFRKAILSVANQVDLFYCRVPDPFSWMPALMGRKPTIMHFVGDAIEATKYNENWSAIKKFIVTTGYRPEWWLTIIAARKSLVYCNGFHLVERLRKKGVRAQAVISSTVSLNDLPSNLVALPHNRGKVAILFLSYIRYAKGINCLMDTLSLLKKRGVKYHCNIIGDGEMMEELRSFVRKNELSEFVTIFGQINNRQRINELMHESDLFLFTSLSEGSPRVVIEAASQGLPVISTPVGSLPFSFKDGDSIRFFPFNDVNCACNIIEEYLNNPKDFLNQRDNAFTLVKEKYTLESFLSKVFTYEE